MTVRTIGFDEIRESGLLTLIGINSQVDQNEYTTSASFDVSVIATVLASGEILSAILISTESGTGAVQTPAGTLYFLDADPAAAAGDTALTAAEWATVIGKVEIAATDWTGDANGSVAFKQIAIPFHGVTTLYAVFELTSAASVNDAAGDDELVRLNVWYRRDT